MTIKQMKEALKEMKSICKFEDKNTNIMVGGNSYCDFNKFCIDTIINDTRVSMWKEVKDKDKNKKS